MQAKKTQLCAETHLRLVLRRVNAWTSVSCALHSRGSQQCPCIGIAQFQFDSKYTGPWSHVQKLRYISMQKVRCLNWTLVRFTSAANAFGRSTPPCHHIKQYERKVEPH